MQDRFLFHVRFWDDDKQEVREERGVLNAKNFQEVMYVITTWYGDDALDYIEVNGFDEGMFFLTKEAYNQFKVDPDNIIGGTNEEI